MHTLKAATALGAALIIASSAQADAYSTSFEQGQGFTAGQTLPDGVDGATWVTATNGTSRGTISNTVAHSGTQSLEIIRDTSGADGVIHGVRSPELASGAGEAQSGASANVFSSSFWFRTGDYDLGSNHFISINAWSNDRMSYMAFDYSNDILSAYAVGITPETTSGTGFDEYPDTSLATNLTVGAWYQVQQTITFNSGSSVGGDDIVTFLLRDALGNQVGSTAITGSWDAGNLGADTYNTGTPRLRPVDQLNFAVRSGDAGTVGYLDDVSYSATPEAGTWAMMVMGFGVLGAVMRRRPRTNVSFA